MHFEIQLILVFLLILYLNIFSFGVTDNILFFFFLDRLLCLMLCTRHKERNHCCSATRNIVAVACVCEPIIHRGHQPSH
jgi:hypothetical protein